MWPQIFLKILVPGTPLTPPYPPWHPPGGWVGQKWPKCIPTSPILKMKHFWAVKKIDLLFHSECTCSCALIMTNYQRPMKPPPRPYLPVNWIIFAHKCTGFDNRHCLKPNRFSLSLLEVIAWSFISCITHIWSDWKRNISQLHSFTLVTEGQIGWVRSLESPLPSI